MIYALVEPSIYMIASILPTTRHLYRRVRRKAQRAVELRSAKSNTSPQSADIESTGTAGHGITRQVDIWQANTNSSQEELTMGEFYQSQQQEEWNEMRDVESNLDERAGEKKPRQLVKKQIKIRDGDGVRAVG